jgi:LemA protein
MRTRNWLPAIALLLATGCGPCGYNRVVAEEQQVDHSWSQVESQMQRRADLIPILVETAKGYVQHEPEVFAAIANARAAVLSASTRAEKIEKSNQLDVAISRLVPLGDTYPQLKSDAQYAKSMEELLGIESRLVAERARYNEAVRIYNADVKQPPGAWFAKLGNFPPQKESFPAPAMPGVATSSTLH